MSENDIITENIYEIEFEPIILSQKLRKLKGQYYDKEILSITYLKKSQLIS